MIGKLSNFKWTDKAEHSRDLIFIAAILGFGVLLVMKLAPYYQDHKASVVFNAVQTVPNTPKGVLETINASFSVRKETKGTGQGWGQQTDRHAPSVAERLLFDGQSVILKVKSLNPYSSNEQNQPLEVSVVSPLMRPIDSEVDFSTSDGGKLIGTGSPNLSTKRLYLTFTELITREGRSYAVQGQAINPETLSAGIEGDYSSGLPLRLLGVIIDRAIVVGDQVGTAHVFSALGPEGTGAQEFKKAAMETNQQASQSIAAEATKDMRETPPEITLPVGTELYVRLKVDAKGGQK